MSIDSLSLKRLILSRRSHRHGEKELDAGGERAEAEAKRSTLVGTAADDRKGIVAGLIGRPAPSFRARAASLSKNQNSIEATREPLSATEASQKKASKAYLIEMKKTKTRRRSFRVEKVVSREVLASTTRPRPRPSFFSHSPVSSASSPPPPAQRLTTRITQKRDFSERDDNHRFTITQSKKKKQHLSPLSLFSFSFFHKKRKRKKPNAASQRSS